MVSTAPVVGFDLDMTLIDSRAGMRAVVEAINNESGYGIDSASVAEVLGPPLSQLLAPWVPETEMDGVVRRFRELYSGLAIEPATAMPGAFDALVATRDAGAQILVLTGKFEPNAKLHLDALELPYDLLHGSRWAGAKAEILTELSASVYVGDHPADMRAARDAGARAVGVPSGGMSADDLNAAGADVVLSSLEQFGGWLVDNPPATVAS